MTHYVLNKDTRRLLEINGKMQFTEAEIQSLLERKTIQNIVRLKPVFPTYASFTEEQQRENQHKFDLTKHEEGHA